MPFAARRRCRQNRSRCSVESQRLRPPMEAVEKLESGAPVGADRGLVEMGGADAALAQAALLEAAQGFAHREPGQMALAVPRVRADGLKDADTAGRIGP